MRAFAQVADAYVPFSKAFCNHLVPTSCPDTATGAFLSLLGFDLTVTTPEWSFRSESYAVDTSFVPAPTQKDWWLSHYVRPRKMLALHERTLHETVDRIQSAIAAAKSSSEEEGRKNELVLEKWKSSFVSTHEKVVKRKIRQLAFFDISVSVPMAMNMMTTEVQKRAHEALFGTENNVLNNYLHNKGELDQSLPSNEQEPYVKILSLNELEPHAMITAHLDVLREMQVIVNDLAKKKWRWHDGKDIPLLTPTTRDLVASTSTKLIVKPTDSWFCPSNQYSTAKWTEKRTTIKYAPQLESQAVFENQVEDALTRADDRRYYCDKLPQDVRPWPYMFSHIFPELQKENEKFFPYTKSDLVIGVYTGERVVHSRGMAMQDTWLADLPNVLMYTATEQKHIPTVGIRELLKFQSEKYEKSLLISNNGGPPAISTENRYTSPNPFKIAADFEASANVAHWVQLYGLKDMYEKFPDKKWYYIVGCDLYLNVDHALSLLGSYDAEKPMWVSRQVFPRKPIPERAGNVSKNFEQTCLRDKSTGQCDFTWSSGSYGWFLSNAVKLIYEEFMRI